RAFLSPRALETAASVLSSGLAAMGARALAFVDSVATRLPHVDRERRVILPPFRRFSSATEAMADVFDELFAGKLLTDPRCGDVFDILGTSVLEPGRDPAITVTYDPEYIIACDAGRGLLDDGYIPYAFPSRMRRAFESTFRKAQDGARNRLHLYGASGELKGF